MIKATNIDGIKKTFLTDRSFIEYVQILFEENENENSILYMPTNVEDCMDYINDYCPDIVID